MKVLVALVFPLAIGPMDCFNIVIQNCTTRAEALKEINNKGGTNSTYKCLHYCSLENTKLIVNGKIVKPDLSTKNIPSGLIERMKLCMDLKDDNRCELGYKLYKCLNLHDKAVHIY